MACFGGLCKVLIGILSEISKREINRKKVKKDGTNWSN